ncbi:MAG: TerB family tellurite resistance protein [Vicinamibacterales bacterium]
MSILGWLRHAASNPAPHADTDTVRRIMSELDRLDPAVARYLAAFAYVLGRVANADLEISPAETEEMAALLQDASGLPAEQTLLVVEIAKRQNRLFGGTEDFLVTRELREIATDAQRSRLLDSLFAVAAADGVVSGAEEDEIRKISIELAFEHAEYIEARLKYTSQRSVLKNP